MNDFHAATAEPVPRADSVAPVPPLVLLDREKAILEFNRRVLAQARREDVPLLERLRYVTIVSSNLDEFFEVRFADVMEAARLPGTAVTAGEVQGVAAAAHALVQEQYALFNDEVMPALEQQGLVVLQHSQRNAAQRRWVAAFFEEQVRPLLVPVGLDPAHPFPTVANKSLNFIVQLGGRDAFGRENSIAIVKVPRVLPRVIRLPDAVAEGRQAFVLLSSVIRAHLAELFPGREVLAFSQFRVTRDSDLEVDEDDATNLRQALRSGLFTRHFGQAVRLEVVESCPQALVQFLLQQFQLPAWALYRVNGPVNLVRLAQLIDQADARTLRFTPWEPAWPASLPQGGSIFERLQQGNVLLHHPFESFEPVVQFLREAVADPDVLAIKQTIYRTGTESALMEQLLEAARRGKEVTVVVELKARFDEEANINWAERLEAVGAQVVYGIVGLKTHAKLLLVTRRERAGGGHGRGNGVLRRYAHLSTGNYNARTARLYTDLGCMTADPELTADADAVFQQLTGQVELPTLHRLLAAPFALQAAMLAHLKQVARAARAGRPARVVVKCNALTDPQLMAALVEASQAGARIDLVIRGACMLPPGVPGQTDNIRVRSVVGRFLEHTRVFYFRWGGSEQDEALYLSSADWMSRNMLRRVEVAWPMRDAALRQRVIDECLVPYLHDARDAWALQGDGSWRSLAEAGGAGAQPALMNLYQG
ncbi:polyphosphate kinase 1 [Azohydromonas caseinilytica]|uniref:Polyphosphate kinase n=1 Tax=Azohydromonas caseinilytica TaxID=2728836 RepID=A0A848FGM5_9BURK|nr:polyphosphate kinase 1 [Azohydromonas caseinilytica]NML18296.1 polyphosphate kinase 1 [Azohydromonas caseinilytica]